MKLTAKPKKTLTNLAYDAIRTAICDGSLPPGTPLSENDLSRQMGMSRTPVREALRILESQDFVEIRDGLATFVKTLSEWEVRDLFEIRKELEVLAASTALNYITEQEICAMEEEFKKFLHLRKTGSNIDYAEFASVDSKLHVFIVDHCQNKYVKKFMRSIMDDIQRCQLMSASCLGDLEESTTQHLEILDLLKKKDLESLSQKLRDHVDWSLKCVLYRGN